MNFVFKVDGEYLLIDQLHRVTGPKYTSITKRQT